jgi:AP2-associated kinase
LCDGPLFNPKQNWRHDVKQVENVLLTRNTFKLCDFGSCTTKTYFPQTSSEMSRAEDDINRNTTMSYRSPEMLDLYRHQLINEKADIWVSLISSSSFIFILRLIVFSDILFLAILMMMMGWKKALGILLFRICFFKHPFDETSRIAALNVKYEIPEDSPYSANIHNLIR